MTDPQDPRCRDWHGADTGATSPAAQLSTEVVRLVRASSLMRQQLVARGGEGLEWATFLLLMILCKQGPLRASALAATACVDPSTISRQVGHLVELGLVERQADPQDGRATLLAATELGQARHRAVHDRRERAFAAMLEGWAEDDVRTLAGLLHRLTDTVLEHRGEMLDAFTQAEPTAGHLSTTSSTQERA